MHFSKTAGVIGGLGPMATVYFFNMVVNLTDSNSDQEHVDMLISNKATTPDRTDFIIGKSNLNPAPVLHKEALKLQDAGADFLVMTCNTAHYFYDEITKGIDIPFINIVEETVLHAKNRGFKKLCILATTGNIQSELYQSMCKKHGIDFLVPNEQQQEVVMDLIYGHIKKGITPNIATFNSLIYDFKKKQCDGAILGCTELSILKNDFNLCEDFFIDSLEVLARKTIELSGKKSI